MKLQKCPKCNMKPVFMAINEYSGYVTCVSCQTSTITFDDDLRMRLSWRDKASYNWNMMVRVVI